MTTLTNVTIQSRHDTAAAFAAANPVLAAGELACEVDTSQVKAGDGSTAYNTLPYVGASGGLTATPPLDITAGVISIPAADTSTDGYLTSTDWNTFNGKGSGSVTSVAMTVPSWLSVSGSPITTSGTLAVTAAGAQTANQVLASPDGVAGALSVRALVATDIPTLAYVTSVGLSLPAFITVSGSPVTSSGTLTGTLATQAANKIFGGPTTGADAAPTFRSLVSADIPALAYVTSVAMTVPSVLSVSGSPITSSGTLAVTLATQSANLVFAGPTSGGAATPTFRSLVSGDIPALSYVTSVAMTVPSILLVSGSPITSSGTLAVTLATEAANKVFAGPTTGADATPTFRSLVAGDIPDISGTYLPLAGGTLTGALLFSPDNTLDIGASGATRPRTGYFGTSLIVNGATLIPESSAIWQFGVDAASPAAQTLKGADARAGTDTNTAGGNLTIAAGRNTGSAAGGSLLFQTAPAGSTGTAAGTLTTRLTIDSTGLTTSTLNAIGATATDSLLLTNTTAAANGAQQNSPALRFTGYGWGTTAGTSQSTDWRIFSQPTQSTVPTSTLFFDFSVAGGAFGTKASLTSGGVLTVVGGITNSGNYLGSGDVRASASGQIYFSTRSVFTSPSDGVLLMQNFAGNNFTRLQFGGTTSSFPALARSSATLKCRLADDSADAAFTCGDFTIGGGTAVKKILSATAVLDFGSTLAQTDSDLTVTVTGAALGDVVVLGVPNGSTLTGSCYSAWVSATDTVTVRFSVYGLTAKDPASGTFRVTVLQF